MNGLQISIDRESLHDSHVQADGTVPDDEQPPIDEYDRVLLLIDEALDRAKGVE
jgi:hypothetical protein